MQQQQSLKCSIVDQNLQVIQFVCLSEQCQLSRFLCQQCLTEATHQHNSQDNLHIVDLSDLYGKMNEKLIQAKQKSQEYKKEVEKSIVFLKEKIQQLQNLLANIQNVAEGLEQSNLQDNNINYLEGQLLNMQQNAFNQIESEILNKFIIIPDNHQDKDIYVQFESQSNQVIDIANSIKEWSASQRIKNQTLIQQIQDAKYLIKSIDFTVNQWINTGQISSDCRYIVLGVEAYIKIWDYQAINPVKSIKLDSYVNICKFTEDSTLLYAGTKRYIYQFDVNNNFKEVSKQDIYTEEICNICCIENTLLLVSADTSIIKLDILLKKQLWEKKPYECRNIFGLDYNKNLNIVLSGSDDQSIRIFNGNNGSQIIEKLNAHNNRRQIKQVLFTINNNSLLSLDDWKDLIIWNLDIQNKQLQQIKLIKSAGSNISLVLNQQFILATGTGFIKVLAAKGEVGKLIRQLDHDVVNDFYNCNTIQPDSMRAVLIKGAYKSMVCKFENKFQLCEQDEKQS